MKRSVLSILLLLSLLLALSHEIIPHHHHDKPENDRAISGHDHHDHTGHDHDGGDGANDHHPFSNHQHVSVAGDFSFVRFSDDKTYVKDQTCALTSQQGIVLPYSDDQTIIKNRWRIKAVFIRSSYLPEALSLRGPPSLV